MAPLLEGGRKTLKERRYSNNTVRKRGDLRVYLGEMLILIRSISTSSV